MKSTSLIFIAVLFVGSTRGDPDCEKQQYWPNVYDCSKYYECNTEGEKVEMQCPADLLWNPLLTTCDRPENVDCSWTVGPTQPTTPPTTPTTTPTTRATTLPTVDPSLRCDKDGEYFPDTTNCQAFYECIDGVKQHDICPDPLLWNVHIPGCTVDSDCSQVYGTTPVYCENGSLTGDVDDCHRFFICQNNNWVGPLQCPNDLYWSEKSKGCVKIEDSDCPRSSVKIPAVAVDPSLQCDREGEYFPDTTNCQAFYECIDNIKQHNICPDPLLWNVHIPGCTLDSDCSQLYHTTPVYCDNGDLTGDVYDCHRFYICQNNHWAGPLQCPNDLYWSEKTKGCVKLEDSDCPK
ncbi:peritrophin-44-like isoform X2 [Diabrotica undecimpunctata]|uniref:peritrophin-44-like isoform X2 n=1 Tax=Diabrotica undecimpunctata TaxID=50387 RepID=UPI003B63E2E0